MLPKESVSHPRKTIDKKKEQLKNLVHAGLDDLEKLDDIITPEDAKSIQPIDDRTILWSMIMRAGAMFSNNNFAGFINAVMFLEASVDPDSDKIYRDHLKKIAEIKSKKAAQVEMDENGNCLNKYALNEIEKEFWLNKYRGIIGLLSRKGLWGMKGH